MAEHVPARLTPAEGRRFGLTVGAAFAVLGGIALWRERETAALILGVVAAALLLGGAVAPALMIPVQTMWMRMATTLSRFTAPVFMGLVFFVIITPVGVVLRLLGRDPLSPRRRGTTFWVERPPSARRSDLRRQF